MNNGIHILIVDDDEDIRDALSGHLKRMGYDVSCAEAALPARKILAESGIELVVLDIMMPGEDGITLCRHLRETTDLPIILISALNETTDKIVGLEVGADDYLAKPFDPRELVARIRSVLRRASAAASDTENVETDLSFSNWVLDPNQGELLSSDGVIVPLSNGEISLLTVLLQNKDQVLSRDDMMKLSRGRDQHPFERSIDNTIARLRRKIEDDPRNPRIIKTIWGGGYKLVSGHIRP